MLPNDDRFKNLFGTGDATPDFEGETPESEQPQKPYCCQLHLLQHVANKIEAGEPFTPREATKIVPLLRDAAGRSETMAEVLASAPEGITAQIIDVPEGEDVKDVIAKILLGKILGEQAKPKGPKHMALHDDGVTPGVFLKDKGVVVRTKAGPLDSDAPTSEVNLNPAGALVVAGKITAWALKMGELLGDPDRLLKRIRQISEKEAAKVANLTEEDFYGTE